MLPNYAEYKRMDQDKSRGQLYNVQNAINIYTKHWLGLLIFSDINTLSPFIWFNLWCTLDWQNLWRTKLFIFTGQHNGSC
jgi:hypothetical protein